MAREHDIIEFHKGESIEILLAAKNPDGSVITDPATQTIIMTISGNPRDEAIMTFDTSPQIISTNVTNGEWLIQLRPIDVETLLEGRTYYYNLWSRQGTSNARLQASGRLILKGSINY